MNLWMALERFEGRSSLRTFVYRVAHNVALTHVMKRHRDRLTRAVSLTDDDETLAALVRNATQEMEGRDMATRLGAVIRGLRPSDAQIILLCLEGMEHAEIAEITGYSATNVAVRVHRIKDTLARALGERGKR